MKVAILVACSLNGAIGLNNGIPWRLPADLKRFKELSMGHPIIMGRKTWESLPVKPLPGRLHIVISSQKQEDTEQVKWVTDPEEALKIAASHDDLCFIVGGGQLYSLFKEKADILYLTLVHKEVKGDTFFWEYPSLPPTWIERERSSHLDEKQALAYDFICYHRSTSKQD